MTNRKVRNLVLLALLAACAMCKGAQLRDPGEPVDLPLDDLDAAAFVDDGGPAGAMQATAADGGAEAGGAGAGEPEEELGIDLRDE